jgi:dimethylargininase
MLTNALVRPPGEAFAQAVSAQVPRPVIDTGLARMQHAEYCAALRTAGLKLTELPPAEDHPDACFVQDTAVLWGDTAVIARLGIKSRQGEEKSVRRALRSLKRTIEVRPPGTLEGGDVLIVGSRLLVGLSARTNRSGMAQLREALELEGASVDAVRVPEGLHLLSGCTYLGHGLLLATDTYAHLPTFAGLEIVRVPGEEVLAANALAINEHVILPAGYPRTAAAIQERGLEVLPVPLSEFAKADGGATCLSLPY